MAQLNLSIYLRKPVDTLEEGEALYELVKERLADRPDITISGTTSNHYESVVPEEPS